jgi:PAS domain S-box-containing protein
MRDALALQALLHPEDRAGVLAAWDTMTGATDFEFRVIRPDGETRWIRTRAEPVMFEDGSITRIAAVSEDVTEEHELREALRDSEQGFRLLAENSTEVIIRSSLEGTIEYVSPACRTVYGYEPEEMVGRSAWDLVHPTGLAELRAAVATGSQPTGVVTTDARVRRRDGGHVWVESRTHPVRDPRSGEPIEFHTSVRDISERKEAEAAIARARDEAEDANLAKSDFLSRMSHELRTPLHAILGFGKLLSREDLRADQLEQLARIIRGGEHLLELINEVLDISRIERGELRTSPEPVDLGPVLSETLEMIAPIAAARAVTIDVTSPDALHVHADRQRLKQVMLNLLSNAVKYNRAGGQVLVDASPADAGRVRITVADTGPGIAAEDLERVFEPFQRIGAETSEIEGTGLGLTLVEHLVRAMGGEIGIESEVGRGTTFWLRLARAAAPQPRVAREPKIPAVRARGPARTVLYIEDNPSNIRLVERILAARPEVSLLVANQGGLGLELAREHLPALVLLDLNLPDMSGETVLARLRGDERTAAVPVVILSADATPGQVARLRRAGADDYLTKAERAQPVVGPLDDEQLGKLRRLYAEPEPWREFVEVFRQDSRTRLANLATAARAGDTETVWQVAHTLTGSCSLVGASRVIALLADIGVRARADEAPGATLLAALEDAYDEAEAALTADLPG